MPKCFYCGRFLNPIKSGIIAKEIYSMFSIEEVIYYHKNCKKKDER